MNSKKITSKLPQLPQLAPRGTRGARLSAPTAPSVYRLGAVGHKMAGQTRKKLQDVKDCNRRLTDHEVELMRVMHEEFPLGHPEHVGYRKLTAIFQVPRYTVRDFCLYRRRAKGL